MYIPRGAAIGALLFFCLAACAQEAPVPGTTASASKKYIALTFDDGPDAEATPALLDILKKQNAKATFFVLGEKIKSNAPILRRMTAEGHAVGNHGLTHQRLTGMTQAEVSAEIEDVNSLLLQITGKAPEVFRPPYGAIDNKVIQTTRDYGLAIVLWSMYPESWGGLLGAEGLNERIVAKARDGDIVFMHDTSARSVAATERVIQRLSSQNYVFVTVPDLIRRQSRFIAGQTYKNGFGISD